MQFIFIHKFDFISEIIFVDKGTPFIRYLMWHFHIPTLRRPLPDSSSLCRSRSNKCAEIHSEKQDEKQIENITFGLTDSFCSERLIFVLNMELFSEDIGRLIMAVNVTGCIRNAGTVVINLQNIMILINIFIFVNVKLWFQRQYRLIQFYLVASRIYTFTFTNSIRCKGLNIVRCG